MIIKMHFKFTLFLFLLCSLLVNQVSYASGEDAPHLDISIGTIKTEAKQAAIGILISYSERIDENYLITNADPKNTLNDGGWLFDVSPEVEIQTGEEDAFNGIIAKLTGNYIRFDTRKIAKQITPCSSCLFHVFPISFGFESDKSFQNVSSLFEVGYVPFYLSPKSKWKLGLKSKVGVFIQAGYKFEVDDNPQISVGGAKDESEEDPDSEIVRVKFDAGTDLELVNYSKGKYSINLIPRARLWYDLVNNEVYHKYEAIIRFSLGKERSFDLRYEDGSGAPNFNEDEQFSANISFKYQNQGLTGASI